MHFTHEHLELQRTAQQIIDKYINPHSNEWEEAGMYPAHASFCKWRNRISALSIALADSSASSDEASFLDLSSLMGAPCDLPHLQCRLSASLLCVHHRQRHPWVCGGYSGYDSPHECYW